MNKKGLIIGSSAVALVAVIIVLILIFSGGGDAYRSIKVFEIDGSCKVERGGDSLDAFKNMALSSGDSLTVGDGSFARLKLDDDKYVYLEANTKIKLTATGTANDSKTMVYIEHGSMLTEVKKKLSATSSYDIVTPNTTMSIRGTKTLTEVIKDVLGKIKTSAAVIEGHVKFATVQKDKNGKTKFVTNDLSVGQGLAVQTEEKDLVSDEDMKSFAETGATTDGTKVEETSHEELGSELGAATFSDDFLNNAADVLVRSAEEDKAEEKNGTGSDTNSGNGEGSDDSPKEGSTGTDTGVASTGVTEGTSGDAGASGLAALAVLNDMKDNGAAEVPADVSNYVEYVSSTYYSGNPAPVTSTPEPASDPVTTSQNETGTEEGVANGTDSNSEDNNGEDGVTVGEESETEEERLAREEAERLEKEEAERLEKEEQEKKEREEAEKVEKERLEKEEAERLEKEEQEKKEREEAEKAEKEEAERKQKEEQEKKEREEREAAEKAEKERLEKEAAEKAEKERIEKEAAEKAEKERLEREAAEQAAREEAERLAREQAEREAQQNAAKNPHYVDSVQNVSLSSGSSSNNVRVRVGFVRSTGSTGSNVVRAGDLPDMSAGDILPGYTGSAYEAIVIPADDTSGSAHGSDLYGSVSSTYGFTGWYNNAEDAAASDLSKRVMTYPESASSDIQLYPGISKTSTLIIMNPYGQSAGNIVNAGNLPDGVIDFTAEGNEAIYKVIEGTTVTLPVPESGSDINHPYIRKVSASGVNTEFYCYSTSMSLDVSKLYLSNSTAATVGSDKVYYATGSAPTVTVSGDYMTLYMYFVSPVELRLATNGGTLLVSDVYSQSQSTVTVQNMAETSTPQALPGATENTYLPAQKWTVSSQNGSAYDYVFRTVYYGRGFSLPKFTKVTTAPSSGNQGQGSDPGSSSSSEPLYPGVEEDYSRELLCNYRLSSNGPLARFSAEDPVAFENGSENRWIDTGIEYDTDGKCVFTAQLLDWVYMDLRFANEDESDKKYSIGESIPYVILDEEDERAGMYKFAVSPRDLYAAANATTEFGFTVQQTEANDYPKYIYAPDDLIYPWNSVGAKRTATMSDSPTDEMSVLSQGLKNSYAYMGVKNKRLTGYSVFYHDLEYDWYGGTTNVSDVYNQFKLNEVTRSELFGEMYLRADACLVGGKDSAACKIPLKMAERAIKGYDSEGREAWDEGNSRLYHPVVFTPGFETPRTVNVSLEYNATRNASGGYTPTSYVKSDYRLVFSGVDGSCFDGNKLEFGNLLIDVGSLYGGFEKLQFDNCIYQSYNSNLQANEYYVCSSGTGYAIGNTALENNNGETIYVPLTNSQLEYESGSFPDGGFIRGLSTFTDSISTYQPAMIRPVPARSESNKYSCFVTEYYDGWNTSQYYSRVFTASDTFTTATVYGTNTVDGLIMDIAGSSDVSDENKWSNDVYGKAYYGGVVKPYITDGGAINFGTPSESIGTTDMSTYTRSVTRLGAASYIGTNIAEFLGIGSNGAFEKAGMFFFEPYTYVSVSASDLSNAYAYYADPYDDQNTGARNPSPWLVDGTNDKWEWKSVADRIGESNEVLGSLLLHIDSIHLIPEGFVLVLNDNVQYLLYTGTESYTVNMVGTGSTQANVDAVDHRVDVTFKTNAD